MAREFYDEDLDTNDFEDEVRDENYSHPDDKNRFNGNLPAYAASPQPPDNESNKNINLVDEKIVPEASTVPAELSPSESPASEVNNPSSPAGSPPAWVDGDESKHLRERWAKIQNSFVDQPRLSVQQADELVTELVEEIAGKLDHEQENLQNTWKQGQDVSTESLRMALRQYRSFFNRLLT